jgi:putative transposase
MLVREGWRVNRKRVQRVWRREAMQVHRKRHKRLSLGNSANSCIRHRAELKNHVWTCDFLFDRTEEGRLVKIFAVLDEYTRESLKVHVACSVKAEDVINVLAEVMAKRGMPMYVRSDKGPEFIANAVTTWLESIGTGTLLIGPGAPWENA